MQFLTIFSLDETNVEKGPCGALINCSSSQRCARFPNLNISRRGSRTSTNTVSTPSRVGASEMASTSEQTPAAAKSFPLRQRPVSAPQACGHHPTPQGRPWDAAQPPAAAGCGAAQVSGSASSPGGSRGPSPSPGQPVPQVARAGQALQGAWGLPSPGQLSTTSSKLPASPPLGSALTPRALQLSQTDIKVL